MIGMGRQDLQEPNSNCSGPVVVRPRSKVSTFLFNVSFRENLQPLNKWLPHSYAFMKGMRKKYLVTLWGLFRRYQVHVKRNKTLFHATSHLVWLAAGKSGEFSAPGAVVLKRFCSQKWWISKGDTWRKTNVGATWWGFITTVWPTWSS